ncbi:MAG: CocE/NonD family hydrolase [Pseudomonadota bacterium]
MSSIAAGLLLAASPVAVAPSHASSDARSYTEHSYVMETVKLKMRDGVELHTEIMRPRNQDKPLPFFMIRTPYGTANGWFGRDGWLQELAKDEYIFVFQEMRGTARSGGDFILNPPFISKYDETAVDEATDAYDTVEWLTNNVEMSVPNVGVSGCSYDGYAAILAGLSGHPAIKAIAPQSAMADLYRGDDFFWNGIPFAVQGPFFIPEMEARRSFDTRFDSSDAYDWHLKAGALKDIQPAAHAQDSELWSELVKTDRLTDFWASRVLADHTDELKPASLHVMGWFDGEDFPGPITAFEAADKNDRAGKHRAIIGPWNHCMYNQPEPGTSFGPLKFSEPTADQYKEIEAKFMRYHLKGEGSLRDMPQVQAYETGVGGGWKELRKFPSQNVKNKAFYFGPSETLSTAEPGAESYGSYISDPLKPVPNAKRPIDFFTGDGMVEGDGKARSLFLVEDQRFAQGRPDVMVWTSEPLEEDLVINGRTILKMYAESTGTDVDWIAQLIDVYPDNRDPVMSGYRIPVTRGALRASLRNDLRQPEPLQPNVAEEYEIKLEPRLHRFAKGHRIQLQLQSTYFPYLARNPQKFIAPEKATQEDFTVVTNKIHYGGTKASQIILPISE